MFSDSKICNFFVNLNSMNVKFIECVHFLNFFIRLIVRIIDCLKRRHGWNSVVFAGFGRENVSSFQNKSMSIMTGLFCLLHLSNIKCFLTWCNKSPNLILLAFNKNGLFWWFKLTKNMKINVAMGVKSCLFLSVYVNMQIQL